jgi:hypothetical protein
VSNISNFPETKLFNWLLLDPDNINGTINVSNVKHRNKTTLDRPAIEGPMADSVGSEAVHFRHRIAEMLYAVCATDRGTQ